MCNPNRSLLKCSALKNFTLSIQAPDNIIEPSVILSGPSVIGDRGDLTIDYSSSLGNNIHIYIYTNPNPNINIDIGHGGRPWLLSLSYVIITNNEDKNCSYMSSVLTSQLRSGRRALIIANKYLLRKSIYQISITLVNFLSGSSIGIILIITIIIMNIIIIIIIIGTKIVSILNEPIPVVSIIGSTYRTTYAYNNFHVFTSISSSSSSLSNINTIWKVCNDGIDMKLVSSSVDKTTLKLPAYRYY